MTLENERQIVLDWKNGNKNAYEKLVRHYMSEAFLTAYGFVGNAEDARDLSQDAFIKAYRARDRFDASRPFYPWLYRILKNHCLNFVQRVRKPTVQLHYEDSPDRERFASDSRTPLEQLERNERHRMLHAAIAELSENHREIIVLKNFKGYAYADIAELLDVPIGTVMSRLYYARRALKEIVERMERQGVPAEAGFVAGGETAGEVV